MTDNPLPPTSAPLKLVSLPGSERTAAVGLQAAATSATLEGPVQATVVLRRRAAVPDAALSGGGGSADFAATYGADPADVEAVTGRLGGLGLTVDSVDVASRRVRVTGSVADVSRIFGTELAPAQSSRDGGAAHRVRTGGLSIPAELDGIITAVLGLDDRPQSRARLRLAVPHAVSTSYTPVQLGTIYDFPTDADGTGQTVAIIELGGGFRQSELDTYFGSVGVKSPAVSAVSVDGAVNDPGTDENADGEVMLDIEVVGALVPGASIVVYFAPNTDAGFLDAVSQAAHASPTPAAISISWGQSEESWTAQARQAMDDAFVDAAALGATVTVAAGDDGSSDRVTDGAVHVDFPASSPHALACGGTRLTADPASGTVSAETVWNDGSAGGATGGGYSTVFARPDYQASIGSAASGAPTTGTPGRGVPDVAADADPQTGYQILVDGKQMVIGGTSAVAPLWAALIARLVQSTGKPLGLIQPTLYAGASANQVPAGFRDVTQGNNGAYSAGPGWDACTGLGVPVGTDLARLFAGSGSTGA